VDDVLCCGEEEVFIGWGQQEGVVDKVRKGGDRERD
jgi:hypothetical protein